MTDFIPIRNYSDPLQASMAKELLTQNDIICYLDTENHSFASWVYISSLGGVSLLVAKEKYETAKELIEIFDLKSNEEVEEKCPKCSSAILREQNSNWFIKLIWCLISFTPAPYNNSSRVCKNCGNKWHADLGDV
ncbi:DUF2007 domain-containing protein [Chitinispirillales bacterium ANBcel5]|uniref:putative signal transducing protein n=1 Tax=Cellulosispirillum alkaliphilum TaxID=3039283 RepID=UPI002A58C78B|nr:DUF2007 domain-containing protein [Chitinispirillales bacterium ANBcel5]